MPIRVPDRYPMDSEFYLTTRDQDLSLPLSEEQFRELKRGRKRLSLINAISHKFKLVKSNFELIEQLMGQLGALYSGQRDIQKIEALKPQFNAAINNYILSARIFTSQLKRHVQGCLPLERELILELTEAMDQEYQKSFSYRFVDALYDYVTYYGLGCHAFQSRTTLVEEEGQIIRRYDFHAYVERDFIGGPSNFRAAILAETPDRVEISALLDDYNGSLQRLHDRAISMTSEVYIDAHQIVSEFVNVFIAKYGHEHADVFVVHKTRAFGDKIYDRFPISMYVNNHSLSDEDLLRTY
ncbi:hypothetical protein [Alteromonas lipotrueiana]|uniref:hypothetical protein n=1 Tax=Alteromonas lipotrueiana TaxID=2803815 RepID=UPI001C488B4A|nr:hypothetical protein [Alteromonas lipotrueiana]